MNEILSAVGTLANLGAEAEAAAEERRAEILAEARAAWRAYEDKLIGLWAGLKKDDAEMAALAAPPPAPPTPPIVAPPPASGAAPTGSE